MAKKTYKVIEQKLHPKFKYVISKKTHIYYNKLNALKKADALIKKGNVAVGFSPTPVYKGKTISFKKAIAIEKNK
tara:strand:- start:20 stop:244 length:225 start_codon:yes stop_codon:yes gene_type:complete